MDNRKSIWTLLKDSVWQWIEDQPFQLAAALSYYTFFSLAPLLIIVIAITGVIFGKSAAENQIIETIQGLIGQQSAQAIQDLLRNASQQPKTGVISAAVGMIALVLGAGAVVGQLQNSLNTIWGVTPKPDQGVWNFARQRFVSFAMVLGIGFLLLVSLVVSAVISAMARWMGGVFGGAEAIAHGLDILVSFFFITALIAMIYKFLPDIRIRWRDVWIGAALTSILFTIGKSLIGVYLGQSAVSSTYGAAGSLITVLLWVYYSALIFFLGAEFTQVYANRYGSGVKPADYAQPIASAQTRETPPPERRAVGREQNNASRTRSAEPRGPER